MPKLEILQEKGLRFYEEYSTPADKHKAQRGAKRGKITGKAESYMCIFDSQHNECISSCFFDDIDGISLNVNGCSADYLYGNCRRIAKNSVPLAWLENANRYFK